MAIQELGSGSGKLSPVQDLKCFSFFPLGTVLPQPLPSSHPRETSKITKPTCNSQTSEVQDYSKPPFHFLLGIYTKRFF
jgi:hypothetical protein